MSAMSDGTIRVAIVTVSDRASAGIYEDRCGPAVEEVLRRGSPDLSVEREIVPDDPAAIRAALERHAGCDFVLTTGGTGIGPRDFTPEATEAYCDRALPGVAEMLRAVSIRETPFAALSRGFAGQKGRTIVVNFPGSVRGAGTCTAALLPIMTHAVSMLRGEGH